MEKKFQKILSFVFIFLIINSSLIFTTTGETTINADNEDEIDQQQTQADIFEEIYGENYIAQSFKPTLGNLTRIKLLLSKIGNINSNITIGIRKEINKKDFINISLPPSEITREEQWIQINFTNIKLNTEGKIYYIICKTQNGDENNNYRWHASNTDTYTYGTQYSSPDAGETWFQNISRDLCFITYGKEIIKESALEIKFINGKFGNTIDVGIENTGKTEINNIEVLMRLEVGLFLKLQRQYIEEIESLKPGLPGKIIFGPVIVLRPFAFGTITIYASAENTNTVNQTKNAFFLPFYIHTN